MLTTVLLILFVAFMSWMGGGYITHNAFDCQKGNRNTAYLICVLVCVAAAALIGLAVDVPNRSGLDTAFRTALISIPFALLGVRMALGKPQNT